MAPSSEDLPSAPPEPERVESNRAPDQPAKKRGPKNKTSGGAKLRMRAFGRGTKGGKPCVTMAGAVRFTDEDGTDIIMYSGDTAYVPEEVERIFNSGKQTFVDPVDDVPTPGDPA